METEFGEAGTWHNMPDIGLLLMGYFMQITEYSFLYSAGEGIRQAKILTATV